jgi:hypothetical protein
MSSITGQGRHLAARIAAKAVRDLARQRERDAERGCRQCADAERPIVDALREIAHDIGPEEG